MAQPKLNIYHHSVDLKKIRIKNASKEIFVSRLEDIPYRGYEVEDMANGNKIVIVKPGGKRAYGRIAREDFLVFIYNPSENELWQITHQQLFNDLKEKGLANKKATLEIIMALQKVYEGEEPDDFLASVNLSDLMSKGIDPETILKAYKWIWGQEDVNYFGEAFKGRAMSWEGLYKENGKWHKSGTGILDLKNDLQENSEK